MSDSGLYLNWNPTWPHEQLEEWGQEGVEAEFAGLDEATVFTEGHAGEIWGAGGGLGIGGVAMNMDMAEVVEANVDGGGAGAGLGIEPRDRKKERERLMDKWERQYQQSLKHYKSFKDGKYCCASWNWYCDEH